MRLEIRDTEDATVYDIGPEGAVLGRERAKTDISLRDESISKRHARIFCEDGGWFLEDLNSSNGTYVDDQRIGSPVPLMSRMSFSLAQRRFEVVYLDAGAGPDPVDDFPPPGIRGPTEETGGDMPPLPGMESQAFVSAERGGRPGGSDDYGGGGYGDDDFGGGEAEPDAGNTGVKYFLVAVPKAVGYYLVQVPLMGLNPIGVIKKGVQEQPRPTLSNMEVAAYAIPAGIFTALVNGVFGAVAQLVNGNFGAAIGVLVGSLPAAAIGGAIGGVVGYFAHPILKFLINLLKGESTPKSRSNFILMSYTFVILTAVPSGIALVVASLPVPFISLLGPILTLLVTLVGLFLYFLWVKAFDLHKAVRYVVLALGLLAVLGTGFGFVTGLIDQISGLGSGDDGAPGLVDGSGLSDDEKAALEAAAEADPEAAERLAAARAAAAEAEVGSEAAARAKAALAKLEAKQAELVEAAQDDAKAAAAAAEAAADDAMEASDDAMDDAKADPPPPPPPPKRAPPPPPKRAAPPPPPSGPINMAEHPLGETGFTRFLDKRKAVERAIGDNPKLLERRAIRKDYERLWDTTYDVREKYRKRYRRKPRWQRDKVYSKLKDQEVYDKTKDEVDRLYDAIFN